MPALDSLIGGGAIHIADQNKQKPIKTLCGQALDKDTTRFFMDRNNFLQATCKVCRGIYFEESWTGEVKTPESQQGQLPAEQNQGDGGQQQQQEEQQEMPVVRPLFGNLQKPVNDHSKQGEKTNGA